MNRLCFSVIMPCYNSERYVSDSINSVINQTYTNWELILVNDGSTDNTLDLINEYAANDERIKVFSKENGGYATAVNFGLDNISGDYFLFLGSDDRLGEDLFERLFEQIELLEKFPDMIAFRTRYVFNGSVGGLDKYTNFDSVAFNECKIKEFIEKDPVNSDIFSIRDTSRCYKRELLGDTRYFGKTGMDADGIFSMLICHKANSFLNVPVDGYFWTLRSDSVSATPSLKKHLDRIANWHAFFEFIAENYEDEITETEKKYLSGSSSFIVELALLPKLAIKYRKYIKSEAKFSKEMALKFKVKPHRFLAFVSTAPIIFSVIYTVKIFFERLFGKSSSSDK